jgi:hypothetical protein
MYRRAHGARVQGLARAGRRLPPIALASAGWIGFGWAGDTNLQLTTPLLWTMIAISTAGAIVTFAFLVYALYRFRDPAVRRRRYG